MLAPSAVPPVVGGAERMWDGLARAVNQQDDHTAEIVTLPTREHSLPDLVDSYEMWSKLDVSRFDLVVSGKYPAWMAPHPNHVVYMQHTLRGLYDTYPRHLGGFEPTDPLLRRLAIVAAAATDLTGVHETVAHFRYVLGRLGADHPAFSFPGPLARYLVHTFDRVALTPPAVRRHLAISATVAGRRNYFPPGVKVEVVRPPSDLPTRAGDRFDYFFTASRLDPPKRIDMLIDAMAHVPGDAPLRIAGTGPEAERLRERAAGNRRVELVGYVDDDELVNLYADALAVPFVPRDEDLGLITVEAMASGKPVLTTTDAGGPTELVVDGHNGFVVSPTAEAVGVAMARLASEPGLARTLGAAAARTATTVTWRQAVEAVLRPLPAPRAPAPLRRSGRPRIVVTSTFPVYPRAGGGQLRCFHLYGALTDRFDVEVVSLTGPVEAPTRVALGEWFTETVVPKSWDHERLENTIHGMVDVPVTDIVADRLIDHTPAYLDALRHATDGATAVLLAHPFLAGAVERVAPGLPVVYDAHNAETHLKASLLPETPTGLALLDEVRQTERRAVARSMLLSVCSTEDRDTLLAAFGSPADLDKAIEIPNGVDVASVPFTGFDERTQARARWLESWRALGRQAGEHVALFSGSWHLPNVDAAEHVFELAAGMPEVLFLLMGSHGDYFGPWYRTPPNVVRLGAVPEAQKAVLLRAASVALNPMTRGSGTNLKIVEYFAAGIPVVSTPLGARGLAVEHGVHLEVAELADFPAAIDSLVGDTDRAAEMAGRARSVVEEQYDWAALGHRLSAEIAARLGLGAGTRTTVAGRPLD